MSPGAREGAIAVVRDYLRTSDLTYTEPRAVGNTSSAIVRSAVSNQYAQVSTFSTARGSPASSRM